MRIGHYAPRIGAKGGVATYIQRLGPAQSAQGHDVVYLSRDGATEGSPTPHHAVSDAASLFARANKLQLDILHLHKGVHPIPEDRVPIIRTMHGHQAGCPSGSRYLERPGKPCDRRYTIGGCLWGHVVDHCGSVRPHKLIGNFVRIRQEIELVSRVPTLTVSDFIRRQMIRAGCPAENLRTLHSPAPDASTEYIPPPRDGVPRFVYLGRLVPQKGVDWALRALAQVSAPIHLDIAGEGPQRADMEALAADLGVRAQVTFHGWVDQTAVPALLEQARAVVFPSVWHEPAGLVSLEAAAHGRALITSEVGGIPEYAHEDFALLAPPHDVAALADHMTTLATAPDRAETMGQRGRQRVRTHHTMRAFLHEMDQVYNAVHEAHEAHNGSPSLASPSTP